MGINDDIKLKIKTLLKEKSWTILTLATRTKIPKQTLYNNLEGDSEIKISTLQKLSPVLGVEMDYWFKKEETNLANETIIKYPQSNNLELEFMRREIQDLRDHLATKEILIQRLLKEQSQPSHQGK
jgi:transcriptional regulator with XRE-family HTH domain